MIHPKAHVDADVVLGEGTRVWQFASLTRGVVMGRDCAVSPFAMLDGSSYGDRVHISAHVAAGPGFKVGNDVFLAPGVVLVNDLYPAVDKTGYDEAWLRAGVQPVIVIDDEVIIGVHAIIMPGVRIGKGAVIGAGSIVSRDVPAGMVRRRDGDLSPLPPDWRERRMRWPGC